MSETTFSRLEVFEENNENKLPEDEIVSLWKTNYLWINYA